MNMLKLVSKISNKRVIEIAGYVATAGMAVVEAMDKSKQAKTIAELTEKVAKLESKIK